jgi:murein DD-endopeptidase MepM/ murein hydrolase activator NlpD
MRAPLSLGAVLTASILLCGCIPQGAGDYRMRTPPVSISVPAPEDQMPAASRPTADAPQAVPEAQVINPTPSWSPAVVVRNLRRVNVGLYTVQSGDTMYRIVAKTGASLTDIASANNLAAPYTMRIGQTLTIPQGLYHTVNAGETGIAIARAYGAAWNEIVTLNSLQEPFGLNAGQRLRLPDSTQVAETSVSFPDNGADTSPEDRANAFSLNIDDIVTGSEPAYAAAVETYPMPSENGTPPRKTTSLASNVQRPSSFAGSFAWPADGVLLSRFGTKGGGKVNDGINISAGLGAPVRAASNGVVVYSGNEIGVFGGLILVDHGGGWITAYGHLGQLQVARGDKVRSGQSIGTIGDTGYVDRPQLHFEIRKDRRPLDPMTKLPVR